MNHFVYILREINGKRTDDLTIALQEVTRMIREGYTSGHDSNDDGNYEFDINGKEEEYDT